MTPEQQMAQVARKLIATCNVAADDQTLNTVMTLRQWLAAIESGALLVTPKPEAKPEEK